MHSNSIPTGHSRTEILPLPIFGKRTNAPAYSGCSSHVNALYKDMFGPHINQPCSFTATSTQIYRFFKLPLVWRTSPKKKQSQCTTVLQRSIWETNITRHSLYSEFCWKPNLPSFTLKLNKADRHQYKTLPFKSWVVHSLGLNELWVHAG